MVAEPKRWLGLHPLRGGRSETWELEGRDRWGPVFLAKREFGMGVSGRFGEAATP